MKKKPVTDEYALKMIDKALKESNLPEADKWKFILQANAEFRLRVKERMRHMKENDMRSELKEMYRNPV